ncbi:NUDIX hydrolase [Tsukamurella sp. 8F]|uniref:NUDIX domain-containing protein n=1 Tax=unclassified Tsukamurella TaxID=2633480 RepID=UPI0023BA3ABB|nr:MULTISPECIES: NUDIX hydrolase [unclassified Tsukamurella]MDF0532230.1 NUDIX hydrolase [Tsukamurella sp. 8J]MDF0588065.1 NUDIX hydrolase [Tsukamurella sp. 8F]
MPDVLHDFETVTSDVVYEGPIFAVRTDEVTMPGGGTAKRDIVEHDGAVAVVAMNPDGAIAMVNQYRHAMGRRMLEIPAGLMDHSGAETPHAAAQRELAEETGLGAREWHVLVDLAPSPGFTDEMVRVFLATDLRYCHIADYQEDEELDMTVEWINMPDAVQMVLSGEIVNSTSVAAILAATMVTDDDAPLRTADAPWPCRPTAFASRKGRPVE